MTSFQQIFFVLLRHHPGVEEKCPKTVCPSPSEWAACTAAPFTGKEMTGECFNISIKTLRPAHSWAHQTAVQMCLLAPSCGNHQTATVSRLTAQHCCQITSWGMCGSLRKEWWRVFCGCFPSGLQVCRMVLSPWSAWGQFVAEDTVWRGWTSPQGSQRLPGRHHTCVKYQILGYLPVAWNTRSFIWLLMLFFFLWSPSKPCILVQHYKADNFFILAPSFIKSYPE